MAPNERPDRLGGSGCGALFRRNGDSLVDRVRHALRIAVVATAALVALGGCASTDVQCGLRADYQTRAGVPFTGRTTIAWTYGQGFSGRQLGEMIDTPDVKILRLRGDPPDFNDVCGLALLGHELAHALGGRHQ